LDKGKAFVFITMLYNGKIFVNQEKATDKYCLDKLREYFLYFCD